jgi:DNA-binding NarL/FixJ family response regulator
MMDEGQLKEFLGHARDSKIFILADRPNNREGITILRLGCIGYSNTYISAPRLNLAARTVLSGLVWTGTSLMQHLLDGALSDEPEKTKNVSEEQDYLEMLSRREHQVASLVLEGLQNREIAERLDIAERTVKAHLSSIYNKTETSGRIGLIKKISRK